ncbi:hypothetical protein VO70_20715 [Aeromonas salmonicida]|nr:hypothetical protein VO70_20715 [Aeromonas salmonicida]
MLRLLHLNKAMASLTGSLFEPLRSLQQAILQSGQHFGLLLELISKCSILATGLLNLLCHLFQALPQ